MVYANFKWKALNFIFLMLFSYLKHEGFDPQITSLPNLHQGKHAAFFLYFWYQIIGFLDLDNLC